jgi:hypothetical protein
MRQEIPSYSLIAEGTNYDDDLKDAKMSDEPMVLIKK